MMMMNQKSLPSLCTFVMMCVIGALAFAGASACTAPVEEHEVVGVSRAELMRAQWRNLKKLDGACKFEADANGPADAFVIANGQDISIVFTRLGEETKLGPAGKRVWSVCNFEIPVGIPSDSYVAGWHQSLTYGAIKPVGVAAGLGLDSSLNASNASDMAPGGSLPLPAIDVRFPRDVATNIALEIAKVDFTLDSSRPRHQHWLRQACRQGRASDVTFVGGAYTWAERSAASAQPVILAIDGVDARVDLGADIQLCPSHL